MPVIRADSIKLVVTVMAVSESLYCSSDCMLSCAVWMPHACDVISLFSLRFNTLTLPHSQYHPIWSHLHSTDMNVSYHSKFYITTLLFFISSFDDKVDP